MPQTEVVYRHDRRPNAALIAELYRSAPLNRPVDDVPRIAAFYAGSNVIITAWAGERLVGILRGWTDGAYDGYVCDLAIAPDMQKAGVGRGLLNELQSFGPKVQWILRASKIAENYYAHVGWQKIENGWFLPRSS